MVFQVADDVYQHVVVGRLAELLLVLIVGVQVVVSARAQGLEACRHPYILILSFKEEKNPLLVFLHWDGYTINSM